MASLKGQEHGEEICGFKHCHGELCQGKNRFKNNAKFKETNPALAKFMEERQDFVHSNQVRVNITPTANLLENAIEKNIFSEVETNIRDRRAKLQDSANRLEQMRSATGLSEEDMSRCFTPNQLREKMIATGLSREYIDRTFPHLETDFNNQFDLLEVNYQEFSLNAQKYFKANPEKLHGILSPEVRDKLKNSKDPEEVARLIDTKGINAIHHSESRKRRIQEFLDAGFTEADLQDYRATMGKIVTDPDYQKKAENYNQEVEKKRPRSPSKKKTKYAKTGLTIIGKSMMGCVGLPLGLAVDFAGICVFKKYRRPRLFNKLSKSLMRRW